MILEKVSELERILDVAKTPRRPAAPRHAVEALRARLGQVGEVRRRVGEVRPHDDRDARGGRDPEVEEDARLPRHAPLPHRLADHRHPEDQAGDQGGGARLREAPAFGRRDRVPEPRRRPRRRLRRVEDGLRLLDELHGAGVRQRHRLHDQDDLRRGEGPRPDARDRVGTRRDRLPLGPRHERRRRGGPARAGPDREAGRRREPRRPRAVRHLAGRDGEERPRELPRRDPVQGGALHPLQPRLRLARGPVERARSSSGTSATRSAGTSSRSRRSPRSSRTSRRCSRTPTS